MSGFKHPMDRLLFGLDPEDMEGLESAFTGQEAADAAPELGAMGQPALPDGVDVPEDSVAAIMVRAQLRERERYDADTPSYRFVQAKLELLETFHQGQQNLQGLGFTAETAIEMEAAARRTALEDPSAVQEPDLNLVDLGHFLDEIVGVYIEDLLFPV